MMLDAPAATSVGELTAEGFCARYSAAVCRFAAIVCGGELEAEDIAQESLFKCLQALAGGRVPGDEFRREAWVWRVVSNTASDARRRRRREQGLLSSVLSMARGHRSVEDDALDAIGDESLAASLKELRARDRVLLALRYGADLSVTDVGRALSMNEDSASAAIRRALSRLRIKLANKE